MGLDDVGLAGRRAGRLDDVGIDGALGEPAHVIEGAGALLEDLDEQVADDLAFLLGIGDAGERREKAILGVDANHLDPQMLGEGRHHLVRLVQAQQTVVDEDAGELVADGAVQKRRHHRRVHAAGEREQHGIGADAGAHARDAVLDDVLRRPQLAAAADLVNEARQDARALTRVRDLRVELDAVEAPRLVGDARDGRVVGGGDELEALGQSGDAVAVAHPHIEQPEALLAGVILDVLEQPRVAARTHARVAELAPLGAFDAAAELRGHGMHAVADTEHRNAEGEHGLGSAHVARLENRLGTTGENDAARRECGDCPGIHVESADLAVDPRLAHPARDQLGVLGAEIQDQDAIGVNVLGRRV